MFQWVQLIGAWKILVIYEIQFSHYQLPASPLPPVAVLSPVLSHLGPNRGRSRQITASYLTYQPARNWAELLNNDVYGFMGMLIR